MAEPDASVAARADTPATAEPRPSLPSTVVTGPLRSTLLALALPVLAEQVLNTFVGLFDTWLAGRIGPAATSAVGLAAYVSWLASMVVMLVGTGTTALVARHAGAGDRAEANRDTNQSMTLAVMLGAVLLVGFYAFAPLVARFSNMTGRSYMITVDYLRFEAIGHVFMSLTLVGCAALRGVGDMRAPMILFAVINAVNIVTSCLFVFALDLGTRGIVLGTVTARLVGALGILLVLLRGRSGLVLRRRELRLSRKRIRRILHIGLPAAADGAVMWAGHFALVAVIARVATGILGQACFAAHIIAVRVEALTYLPATAWAAATATMIGQSIGAGRPDRAKKAGHEAVLQCGLLSLGITLFFYVKAPWIYENMSLDPLVRAAGTEPFRILALLQTCMVVSIVYIGGLRGAGDTRFPLVITVIGVLIRLSAGYYFGIVCAWGLLGAWIGMFGDMIIRAVLSAGRFLGGRWLAIDV